jgi:transcriptional regulator with XRE-family HTH domain
MDTKRLIGVRIKELRKHKELSQEKLADRMNISPKYLSNIERGKENPTLDTFMKIADALHIELSEIFNYSPEASSRELKQMITDLIKNSDKKQLKLFAEIVKAIFMS